MNRKIARSRIRNQQQADNREKNIRDPEHGHCPLGSITTRSSSMRWRISRFRINKNIVMFSFSILYDE